MKNNRRKRNKNHKPWKNRLSLINFLQKTKLLTVISKAVGISKANKYVKKHRREKLIAFLILTIIIGHLNFQLKTREQLYIALLVGKTETPSRATISKTWGRLLAPLDIVYNHYFREVYRRMPPIKKLALDILIVDIKAIKTKCKQAKVGYINGKKVKGLKIHLSTVNTVPWLFLITPANVHDSTYLDKFVKEARNRIGKGGFLVVADRAFSSLERFAKYSSMGIHLVTPYKKNYRNFAYLETVETSLGKADIFVREFKGVEIYMVSLKDFEGRTWRLLSTLKDAELVVRAYRIRWSIEVLFSDLGRLKFRFLGYKYEAISASILLYLIAYLLLRLYALLIHRRFSIVNFRRAFIRWLQRLDPKDLHFILSNLASRPPP